MPTAACLFCQIVEKKISAKIAYEDEQLIAFHDIAPQAPIHILVIPRQHIATVNDFSENEASLLGHMILTAKNLAKEMAVAEQGYRLNLNCNQFGGQTVFHTHLHLLAGRPFSWPPG
ncbi:MAG: histidine triad nucleotide-binding protein [Gammaproteobacteria bacterium]|nr:histidine triad nucleotide-binding protein [Gammaproteobacteria bacterium]